MPDASDRGHAWEKPLALVGVLKDFRKLLERTPHE